MTNDEKRICAQRIFDSIGEIDDRFIAEAATAYVPKRNKIIFRSVIIAAASVTLLITVLLSSLAVGMLVSNFFAGDDGGVADEKFENLQGDADMESAVQTLDSRLCHMRDETKSLSVSKESIDLFSGNGLIIWKYSDEENYRVYTLSEKELSDVTDMLDSDEGTPIDPSVPTDSEIEGVWIATGDGRVVSPYLAKAEGNVSYGKIFEYEPEYEPSPEFSELLCDVISNK